MPQSEAEKRKQAYLHSGQYAHNPHQASGIYAKPSYEKATPASEIKSGFLHLGRIQESLDQRRKEIAENKRIKEFSKDQSKKLQQQKEDELENLRQQQIQLDEIRKDLKKGTISISELNDLKKKAVQPTLPKGTHNISEKDKSELKQISSDIAMLQHQLQGDPDKIAELQKDLKELQFKKSNETSEYKKEKLQEEITKITSKLDNEDNVGLLEKSKTNPDKDILKKIENTQNELQRLHTRESQIKGVTGFAGIGGHATTDSKGNIIPDVTREKRENAAKYFQEGQYGDNESGILFMGDDGKPHFQKKAKVYDPKLGKNVFTSELSPSKLKELEEITFGPNGVKVDDFGNIIRIPKQFEQTLSNFSEGDHIAQREAPSQRNEVKNPTPSGTSQSDISLFIGSQGKRL